MSRQKAILVGITGGIGSGKSEVCRIFQRLGASVLSADELARNLMETRPDIRRQLKSAFGSTVYKSDGTLNRTLLANIVFSDKEKKTLLDSIVHPHVLKELKRLRRHYTSRPSVQVVEAALIYESGAEGLFDYIIVVDANEEARIRRVMQRDGSSRKAVLQRIRSQMDQVEKITRADFVVRNNGDLDSLQRKVRFLYALFTSVRPNGRLR